MKLITCLKTYYDDFRYTHIINLILINNRFKNYESRSRKIKKT